MTTIKHPRPTAESARFNVSECMAESFVRLFDTMLSIKAVTTSGPTPHHDVDRVTGSVGFSGENVAGAAYIHMSVVAAAKVASALLGLSAEEVGETESNDVVGELCNMITGGLKSGLCDANFPCAMSTPAIIRGKAFHIEAPPDVQRNLLFFDCQGENIAVETHVKFS